ncbi:MAG: hypothetical protein ACUZ9M_07475 [Candidatus Scalindua sp.]
MTKDKLRSKPFAPPRPHVVILGAGASRAAMQTGDKYGNLIPLMDDLPTILGAEWEKIILDAQPPKGNFESTFSWIKNLNRYADQLSNIEKLIESYFHSLSLPDCPTIYDYMVLGLRGKDIIATFNWDPFLMQAHRRNRGVVELPDIRFLHGCVNFATCAEHDILGVPSEVCLECHHELVRGRLFYPVENKDYTKDALINRDWDKVIKQLKEAFHLTIFGYSGPATDYKARKLLLDSWNQTPVRMMCHAEIIDIEDREKIRQCWVDYFPYDHNMIYSEFWESSIAKYPRRTAEWKQSASRYGIPSESLDPIKTDSLEELQKWFSKLGETEDAS